MEKKQLWIVGIVAVIAIAALGAVSYRQFSGTKEPIGFEKSLQEQAAKEQQANSKADGFDSGTLAPVPQSKVSVDGVVAGIESDVDTENTTLGSQATDATSALSGQTDTVNELNNAYDEKKF